MLGSENDHSIVGLRSQVGPACRLVRSIMMGADFFESDEEKVVNAARGRPDMETEDYAMRDGIVVIMKNGSIEPGMVI